MVAFSVFVAVIFLGTSGAQASCGDYLQHHGIMPGDVDRLPVGLLPKEPLPAKKPCQGPSCQQGNKQLPAPAPVVSLESHDRWMVAVSPGQTTIDQICFLPRLNEALSLATDVCRIDRPPKA